MYIHTYTCIHTYVCIAPEATSLRFEIRASGLQFTGQGWGGASFSAYVFGVFCRFSVAIRQALQVASKVASKQGQAGRCTGLSTFETLA